MVASFHVVLTAMPVSAAEREVRQLSVIDRIASPWLAWAILVTVGRTRVHCPCFATSQSHTISAPS
jgi:hypothetical protein